MEDASTINQKTISLGGIHHAECQILFHFLHQPIAQVARSDEFSVLTEERRIVNRKQHVHRWFINGNAWQCFRLLRIGQGIANVEVFDTDNGTKVTRMHFTHFFLSHAFEYIELFNAAALDNAIRLHECNGLIFLDHTATNFTNCDPSQEG